jgi:hypothetical protein
MCKGSENVAENTVEVKVSTHAMEAQRRSRSMHALNLIIRWGLVFNATPRPLYHQGRASIPVVQEAPEPVWPGVQKRKIPCPNRSLNTLPSSP